MFSKKKPDMGSTKVWSIIKKLIDTYPNKISILFSSDRNEVGAKQDDMSDNKIKVLPDLIEGCIHTNNIHAACSKSISLALGDCYEYTVPFGVRSEDTGHTTVIVRLPYIMEGCYTLTAAFSGKVGSRSTREHYSVVMDIEVYLGTIDVGRYTQYIGEGYKVYPMQIHHPEHYPKSEGSESEWTSEQSGDDTPPPSKRKSALRRIIKKKRHLRDIIRHASMRKMKNILPAPETPSPVETDQEGEANHIPLTSAPAK